MDFTEWRNGFPRSVTPIPDTDPDTDPNKKSGGASPLTPTIIEFPSKKELQAKTSSADIEAQELFKTKFAAYEVSYDEMFQSCKDHYDSKNQWVTVKKWKAWIEREKLENYTQLNSAKSQAPENETDIERQNRQYITDELRKEREFPGYNSDILQKKPELRDKYTQYAQ